MRKKILPITCPVTSMPEELDVAAIASVLLTSEMAGYPIENVFDTRRGPGGSRWVAETIGEQTLILAFDSPQKIQQVNLEVEENQENRTQELQLAISHDGGRTYRELVRQEYNFAPPGTTFEREEWMVNAEEVTHLRLWIKPDKGNRPCRASLTALSLQ
jgi:hypothetical protein